MSPKQIRALLVRNDFLDEELNSIEFSKDGVEIMVVDFNKDVDYDATESLTDRVRAVLGWGGFKCGYGGWVLSADHVSNTQDYCDKSNPIHY
jgi:hypothetical protein